MNNIKNKAEEKNLASSKFMVISGVPKQNSDSSEINIDKEKKQFLENAKISLWIDSYNEIFSDFDPRPYSKRELSIDFISEAKRFVRENLKGNFDLVILMPKDIRDFKNEVIIKKRLKEYFQKRYVFLNNKRREILRKGIGFIILGIIFMIITTFILFAMPNPNFLIIFLGVIGEPAGWFLFWEGLNLTIFDSNEKKSDLDFNSKLSKVNIIFGEY
jgi:hypothetical protein